MVGHLGQPARHVPYSELTTGSVIPYLLANKYLAVEDVVKNVVRVDADPRRNNNFRVSVSSRPGIFLKQARDFDGRQTLAREAALSGALADLPGSNPILRYLVPFLSYDPTSNILLFELLEKARSLAVHQRSRRIPLHAAVELGKALGAVHNVAPECLPLDRVPGLRRPARPHVFFLHRADYQFYCGASPGDLGLMRLLQSFPALCELLEELDTEWRSETLIHFDLKLDNVLLLPGKRSVCLVDWEMAAIGDPAWDLGSLFADCLCAWLFSIPIAVDESPTRYLSLARLPLPSLQPALRTIWTSYRKERCLMGTAAAEFLLRAIRYSAARLIHVATERTRLAPELMSTIAYQLQLSWNILRDPKHACSQLLNLALPTQEEP